MNPSPLLCRADRAALLLIDIQTRLCSAMPAGIRSRVVGSAATLAEAAARLQIPTVVTRQYPKGLGDTEAAIPTAGATVVDKLSFSCCGAPEFNTLLGSLGRPQLVIGGMESHICILQSACDLQAAGYQVFVVEDAICSRARANHRNAVARMAQHGITVTNLESVLFEWLEDARHPEFKRFSSLVK
ncbi:MAG TPA: isochorismatase family protein [Gammaproteobacteria bacterium]|nr:isochorismatase family protein [Gammaproteobacteria bacterium]